MFFSCISLYFRMFKYRKKQEFKPPKTGFDCVGEPLFDCQQVWSSQGCHRNQLTILHGGQALQHNLQLALGIASQHCELLESDNANTWSFCEVATIVEQIIEIILVVCHPSFLCKNVESVLNKVWCGCRRLKKGQIS